MGERKARRLLAENLRVLRVVFGWSQEELAAAASLDRSYVSSLERGERNVSLDALEKLAGAFGIGLPELLSEPEPRLVGERLLARIQKSLGNLPKR